jgi:hypothetical protein
MKNELDDLIPADLEAVVLGGGHLSPGQRKKLIADVQARLRDFSGYFNVFVGLTVAVVLAMIGYAFMSTEATATKGAISGVFGISIGALVKGLVSYSERKRNLEIALLFATALDEVKLTDVLRILREGSRLR